MPHRLRAAGIHAGDADLGADSHPNANANPSTYKHSTTDRDCNRPGQSDFHSQAPTPAYANRDTVFHLDSIADQLTSAHRNEHTHTAN